MKRPFFFVGVVCAAGMAIAQAEPGAAPLSIAATPAQPETKVSISEDDLPGNTTGKILKSTAPNAMMACNQFIREKGWRQGPNRKADGSVFIVVSGTAAISVPADSDDYTLNRLTAFDSAMLSAKTSIANFLNSSIETAMSRRVSKPDKNASAADALAWEIASAPKGSPIARLYQDCQDELAAELAKQDLDLAAARAAGGEAAAAAEKKVIQITQSTAFQNSVRRASEAVISGLQAYTSFEVLNENGSGSVGVVAIWSPKLCYYASAIVTRDLPIELGKAKRPLQERVETDPDKLLSMYGVTAMIDDRGEQVLVSYGQAVPRDDTDMDDVMMTYQEAQLYAEAQIRNFAGESIKSAEAGQRGSSSLSAKGLNKYARTEQGYEQTVTARAEAMTVRGITPFAQWEAIHPYTGRMVCGAIVTWSPSAAQTADQAKAYLDAVAAPAAGGQSDYNEAPAADANAFGERLNPKAQKAKKEEEKRMLDGLKPTGGQERVDQFFNGGVESDDDAF